MQHGPYVYTKDKYTAFQKESNLILHEWVQTFFVVAAHFCEMFAFGRHRLLISFV